MYNGSSRQRTEQCAAASGFGLAVGQLSSATWGDQGVTEAYKNRPDRLENIRDIFANIVGGRGALTLSGLKGGRMAKKLI